MTKATPFDAMFSSVIGKEYDMLHLICPAATEMSRLVGITVNDYSSASKPLQVVELGGGTGITTLAMLSGKSLLQILSIDNEPTMQDQAKVYLKKWVDEDVLSFCGEDALTALKNLADDSVDIIPAAYTIHNFLNSYREQVIQEIFRVLKPSGQFINGDRYALNDIRQHTRLIQKELSQYFKVLSPMGRNDLLEQWIVHLFNDESEDHIMRESAALQQMQTAGFIHINVNNRIEGNALITAIKP